MKKISMSKLYSGQNGALFPLDHIVEIGVDKFKCCIRTEHVDDSLAAYLQAQFDVIETRPGAKKLSSQRKAFQRRLHVPVGGNSVLVESLPNKKTYPWAVTIEFNPNPYLRKGGQAIANLGKFLRFLFGTDAHRVLPQAVVPMLHANVDYDINPLEGTLVEAKGKRSGAKVLYDFGGDGVLGSLYVGALHSDRRLCIYDKAVEVLHRELEPHADKILAALASDEWDIEVATLKEKLDGPPRWRLEVRCEPTDAVPVSDIANFASCFDGIRFLHLPHDVAPFNTPEGRLFIACARNDGINAALNALDANQRRRFTRKLAQQQEVDWFNAELLRDAIGQVIGRLSPLFVPPQHQVKVAKAVERQSQATSSRPASSVKFRRTSPDLAKPGSARTPITSEVPARGKAHRSG
ncbi:MAG: hypothetical protein EPN59_09645 [Paraburkholderia sp.]|uniref:hypothetical protein n=1 Tax=Paraburkholderia sp. TaxID=1926495 RepID=UPI00121990F7|nr:hypothetical protein [Paraburkholderia sp.]TAM30116.1 MAG: hypothetical protein EPN59_09645 [Paraburkholderia sp.]